MSVELPNDSLLDDQALHAALQTAHQASPHPVCVCPIGICASWESVPQERWPKAHMTQLGTLRDPDLYEPTFEQHHPQGTHYDAVDAPISALHFPYNRCDVHRCTVCQRVLLKYTEYGGYYVDQRVRWARAALM